MPMMTRRRFIHPTLFVVVWVTTTIMVFTVQSGGVDAFQIIQQPIGIERSMGFVQDIIEKKPIVDKFCRIKLYYEFIRCDMSRTCYKVKK